jgi:hypothetical protein
MAVDLESVLACSRRLLELARSGPADEGLTALVTERGELIRQFFEGPNVSGKVTPTDLQEILEMDGEVAAALSQRRDELWHELAAFRHARSAESAYRIDPDRPARFLDHES